MFNSKSEKKVKVPKTKKTKAPKSPKAPKNAGPKEPPTLEQQAQKSLTLTLGISAGITSIFLLSNVVSIMKYNPAESSYIDTTQLDNIKTFIQTENVTEFLELIDTHLDENKNNKLDIQTVHSSIDRQYPFTSILNKSSDNTTTKLCKFIYTELKPAIISYQLATGELPLKEGEDAQDNIIDLELLKDMINMRDKSISEYTYSASISSDSKNMNITVYKGDKVVPILLFDPTLFVIKEINDNEVSLIQGKHTLILKVKEEFNNIRLDSINVQAKTVTLVDTITNKVVNVKQR